MANMPNQDIKRLAYETVIEWEKKQGRIAQVCEQRKGGYDVRSTSDGGGEERHIEVKGTTSASGEFALELSEFEAMQSDPNWWFYIVTNVGAAAQVHAFRKIAVLAHLNRVYCQFVVNFGREDLA